jgi:excisionase family DNA binding protein
MLRYTTDHPASSYGIPVLVDGAGNAYGEDDLITVTKAAELLQRTRRRIHDYIADGSLPAQRPGNEYLIRAGDLKRVEGREQRQGWPKGRKRKAEGSSGP